MRVIETTFPVPPQAKVVARFALFMTCCNCLKPSAGRLDVPDLEGAPQDVSELEECGILECVRFRCERCDGSIAEITGIDPLPLELPEEEPVLAIDEAFGGLASPVPSMERIEVEARLMLNARIQKLPWFHDLGPADKVEVIAAEVDRYWHIMIPEAVARLCEGEPSIAALPEQAQLWLAAA